MSLNLEILVIILLLNTIIAQRFTNICTKSENDPLAALKQYYNAHAEYHKAQLPVLEKFDQNNNEYDFIIIGSGSGGSVMANRLSAITEWKVLLLEAGEQGDFITDVPMFAFSSIGTKYDWNYRYEKQTKCCLETSGNCGLNRGKVLGGTSVLNGMFYTRGSRENFDKWCRNGNTGWCYENVLSYFKKSESVLISNLGKSPYHGTRGPLSVSKDWYNSSIAELALEAGKELGYQENLDYNGAELVGFGKVQVNVKNGRRASAAEAYVRPAAYRKNLDIVTSAYVTKIGILENAARSVLVKKNGITYKIAARKEVILSAGAINSPAILMRSGVGLRKHLQDLEIPVVKDLPVGSNSQDQIGLSFQYDINLKDIIHETVISDLGVIEEYFKDNSGVLISTGLSAMAAVRTRYADRNPDIEFVFSNRDIDIYGLRQNDREFSDNRSKMFVKKSKKTMFKKRRPMRTKMDKFSMDFLVMLYEPKSRGTVRLASKDPMVQPKIDPNCLSERHDMDVLREGLKLALKVSRTQAFAKYNTTLNPTAYPGCENYIIESDEYWECAIMQVGSTLHHQVGTCKMGPSTDPTAVVSPELKVHGIRGLRVVDASVMPTLPAAHTNAAVYMIGEKAADMVKAEWLGKIDEN